MRSLRFLLVIGGACLLCACSPPQDISSLTDDSPAADRDGYGNPDLNGIWQALGTAHWDLEAHAARAGPVAELGALGAIPAGLGVVVGGEIPYQPWAREQQQENRADWMARDPVVKCYMPGVPRANYMPFPLQIVQARDHVLITHEFAGANRIVYMNRPAEEHPVNAWMGHSRGHWDGETMVIEVDGQVPDTWFDSSGNFHSEALHVVERFSKLGPDTLLYEAEITDPHVFERPWIIRMPLYRRVEENAQLIEFKCVEFAEELMYGHLRKDSMSP